MPWNPGTYDSLSRIFCAATMRLLLNHPVGLNIISLSLSVVLPLLLVVNVVAHLIGGAQARCLHFCQAIKFLAAVFTLSCLDDGFDLLLVAVGVARNARPSNSWLSKNIS